MAEDPSTKKHQDTLFGPEYLDEIADTIATALYNSWPTPAFGPTEGNVISHLRGESSEPQTAISEWFSHTAPAHRSELESLIVQKTIAKLSEKPLVRKSTADEVLLRQRQRTREMFSNMLLPLEPSDASSGHPANVLAFTKNTLLNIQPLLEDPVMIQVGSAIIDRRITDARALIEEILRNAMPKTAHRCEERIVQELENRNIVASRKRIQELIASALRSAPRKKPTSSRPKKRRS